MKKLLALSIFVVACFHSVNVCSQENNYENYLIGIWAMDPVLKPIKGAANVIEYKEDGSYHFYSFKCTGSGKFNRAESKDSSGSWRIDGNNIVTIPEDSEELDQLFIMADDLRVKLDILPLEKKEAVRKSLPKELVDLIDGHQPKSKEIIISMSPSVMKSKQDLGFGQIVYFNNKKVSEIKPSCEEF